MAQRSFELTILAPIPLGHRVRLTWYRMTNTGLFGGTSTEEHPHEPEVEDLDTGVIYCSQQHFEHSAALHRGRPLEIAPTVRGEVAETLEGVVRGCRVFTIRGWGEVEIQTRLVVEPDAP